MATCLALVGAGQVIKRDTGLDRFMVLIAVAVRVRSAVTLPWCRWPVATPTVTSARARVTGNMRRALQDRNSCSISPG